MQESSDIFILCSELLAGQHVDNGIAVDHIDTLRICMKDLFNEVSDTAKALIDETKSISARKTP